MIKTFDYMYKGKTFCELSEVTSIIAFIVSHDF